jgi:hypothetical protein
MHGGGGGWGVGGGGWGVGGGGLLYYPLRQSSYEYTEPG